MFKEEGGFCQSCTIRYPRPKVFISKKMKSWNILLFLQVRHKFELIFLEISAKNKTHFFFKSSQEKNITSPLTGVSDAYESYGGYSSFLGILRFFADVIRCGLPITRIWSCSIWKSILTNWRPLPIGCQPTNHFPYGLTTMFDWFFPNNG